MQERIYEALSRRAQAAHGETPPYEALQNPGFYNDAGIVLEAWMVWQEHHVLPNAGGWLDQDWFLRQDMLTMDRWYSEVWLENKPPGTPDIDDFFKD